MATLKFVQAQKFSLAGSGASIGDTTIILQSMEGIDGDLLTTTDIGTKGFGTLEPGNGTQEEAITFTGITQNANGTATLTGVEHVIFVSPYTETSGITKTHAGASTFVLSNDAAFYGAILSYVDNSLMASGIPMTNLVAGIGKLSVAAASAANPIVVGDNDTRVPTNTQINYITSVLASGNTVPYVVATGTSSALTASVSTSIVSSLSSGLSLHVLFPVTNATGITLNVNSLGAKSIKKNVSSSLSSGDVIPGQVISVVFDGTNFQVLSPMQSTITSVRNGQASHDLSSTTTQTIAHGMGIVPRLIRFTCLYNASGLVSSQTFGSFDGSTNQNISIISDTSGSVSTNISNDTTYCMLIMTTGATTYGRAIASVDSTNITLTWTKSNTPTGTAAFSWEAIG